MRKGKYTLKESSKQAFKRSKESESEIYRTGPSSSMSCWPFRHKTERGSAGRVAKHLGSTSPPHWIQSIGGKSETLRQQIFLSIYSKGSIPTSCSVQTKKVVLPVFPLQDCPICI